MDHLSIDVELELPVASGAVSYALYGVIVHRGALRHREGEPAVRDCSARCAGMSAEVGHYYSYARPSDAVDAVGDGGAAGGWFRLDDSVSSPATFADIQADCAPGSLSTAYMMCYRRRYVAGGGGGAVDAGALAGEGGGAYMRFARGMQALPSPHSAPRYRPPCSSKTRRTCASWRRRGPRRRRRRLWAARTATPTTFGARRDAAPGAGVSAPAPTCARACDGDKRERGACTRARSGTVCIAPTAAAVASAELKRGDVLARP